MPAILPSVYGHSAISPVRQNITYANEITRFENGSEQRIVTRGPLDTFVLTYSNIRKGDRDALTDFVNALHGSYDTTWTFDLRTENIKNPYNGNFALGGKGWSLYQAAAVPWTQTYTSNYFSRVGETSAVAINKATSIITGQTIFANFVSTPFAVSPGQPINVRYWGQILTNGGLPANCIPHLQMCLRIFNGAGSEVGFLYGQSTTGPHGWRQITDSFVVPAGGASASCVVNLFIVNQNLTTATLTNNVCGIQAADIRLYVTGEVGVFPACTFEDAELSWTETSEGKWSTSIKFRQTQTGGQWPTPALGNFPGFGPSNNLVTGFPYSYTDAHDVVKNDLGTGRRVSYYFEGLGGFASRPLRSWKLSLPTLSNAELVRLQQHFLGAAGTWRTFTFVEPGTNRLFTRCRYSSDTLEMTHLQPNLNSVTVGLTEVYGAGWTA